MKSNAIWNIKFLFVTLSFDTAITVLNKVLIECCGAEIIKLAFEGCLRSLGFQ